MVLKFCRGYGSGTVVFCAKLQNHWANEIDVLDKRDFARSELKMGFRRVPIIQQPMTGLFTNVFSPVIQNRLSEISSSSHPNYNNSSLENFALDMTVVYAWHVWIFVAGGLLAKKGNLATLCFHLILNLEWTIVTRTGPRDSFSPAYIFSLSFIIFFWVISIDRQMHTICKYI